jgi:heptosyltransferase-1
MRVLVVKTSSLGDILHTLPALTDASRAIPGIRFDWTLEEDFIEIPLWHASVDRVITMAHRRWRQTPIRSFMGTEFRRYLTELRERHYDAVIDAQGQIIKTIWIVRAARGRRYGLDWRTAREALAALFYDRRVHVSKGQHAVERIRQLFAAALGYPAPTGIGDYGIDREKRFDVHIDPRKLVFLHGTSWVTKEWPKAYWSALVERAGKENYRVHLTWGNAREQARAEELAAGREHVVLLGKLSLHGMARELASAAGVVAVDTGLCHLAAALAVPTLSLYGATSTGLTGAYGLSQHYLSADFPCAPCIRKRCTYTGPRNVEPPCFEAMTPERVWRQFEEVLGQPSHQSSAAPGARATRANIA